MEANIKMGGNTSSLSSTPHKIDKGIICFNFQDTDFILNFPTIGIENQRTEKAIGVWKIKQLKK